MGNYSLAMSVRMASFISPGWARLYYWVKLIFQLGSQSDWILYLPLAFICLLDGVTTELRALRLQQY